MIAYSNPVQQAVAGLSDAELDQVWYANVQAGDAITANLIGQVIADRLGTVGGFISNFFGQTRFPHYEAASGFAGAASSSVSQAAGQAVDTAVATAKTVAGFTTTSLVLLVIAIGGIIYLTKSK